jgi:TolB-like protein/DNA-binding winged helix-turn-helix (wHTH) protein/Tfp pilus assembly protein PilF
VRRFGVFAFDPHTGDLWRDGRATRLQEQVRVVLRVLTDRPGELVTRDELRRLLWADDTFVDFDTGLNVVITKIRQALEDSAAAPRFVETFPRRGYRFIAPVSVDPVAEAAEEPALLHSPIPRATRVWRVAVAVGAVGGLAIALLLWRSGVGRSADLPAVRAVAVLPLENLLGDESQTYLVDGLADALTTDLASIRSLRVVSRQSTKQYRGTTKSTAEIARQLNVDALIGGSVARAGDRLRLNLQLIDAAGDRYLWAHAYEQDRRDLLRLQRDATQELVRAMRLMVTPEERGRLVAIPAVKPEAYDAYLRGRYQLAGVSESEAQTARALAEFERAVAIDPTFARGYAAIATAQQLRATVFQGQPPSLLRAPAIATARRALQLDADMAEAHGILARLQLSEFDWPGAEESFRRALELTPSDPPTLIWYAYQLIRQGRFDEAVESARRAESIDPLDLNTRVRVAYIHTLARKPEEAVRRYLDVLSLDPDRAIAKWFLGTAYLDVSRNDEAVAVIDAALARYGRTAPFLSQHAAVAGRAGHIAEATRSLNDLVALSRRGYVSPALLAMAYTGVGDTDHAFEWFERAYEERSNLMLYFGILPYLDPLKADPRHADLAARIARPHKVR